MLCLVEEAPLHVVHTAVTVVGHGVEEALAQVQVLDLAARAAINDRGGVGLPVGAGDANLLAAERVHVGVTSDGELVEEGLGDGDNGVRLAGVAAAGAHAGLVVGQVSAVGAADCGLAAKGVAGVGVGAGGGCWGGGRGAAVALSGGWRGA